MKTREIDTQKIDCIKLPASLRNGRVLVVEDDNSLLVKKIQRPNLAQIREKLRVLKGQFTEKEINQEIQKYRQSK